MTSSELMSAVMSGIAVVVWLVRLEGRIKQAEKDIISTFQEIDHLRVKHEALDSRVLNELMEVKQSLARIEGRLDTRDL